MTHRPLGARRRRLVLEVPVDEPDGFGGRLRCYVAGPVLWGSLESLGSAAAPRGGRTDRPGLYRVGLRYRPGVTPAMRLSLIHISTIIDEFELGTPPCQPLSVPVSLKIALRGSKGFSVRYIPGLLSTTVKP